MTVELNDTTYELVLYQTYTYTKNVKLFSIFCFKVHLVSFISRMSQISLLAWHDGFLFTILAGNILPKNSP